jgi:hypothetical protein
LLGAPGVANDLHIMVANGAFWVRNHEVNLLADPRGMSYIVGV